MLAIGNSVVLMCRVVYHMFFTTLIAAMWLAVPAYEFPVAVVVALVSVGQASVLYTDSRSLKLWWKERKNRTASRLKTTN